MQAAQSLWRKGRSKNWMIYDAQKKKRKEKEHINKEALLGLHNACVMHCKLLVLAVLKQCIYTPFLNIYILNSEWIHLFVAWSCNVCFKKPPTVFFLYLKKRRFIKKIYCCHFIWQRLLMSTIWHLNGGLDYHQNFPSHNLFTNISSFIQ